MKHSRDVRWAREVAVPQISQLADQGKFGAAYALATKAEKLIPGDPALAKLWPVISYQTSLETTPPGADVYPQRLRRQLGTLGASRKDTANEYPPAARDVYLEVREAGVRHGFAYDPRLVSRYPPCLPVDAVEGSVTLDEVAKIPPGMVRVSPANYSKTLFIPGYEGMPELALKDYWIDQYEVTNRQFKVFVDQGGYQKRDYWKVDFVRDGKTALMGRSDGALPRQRRASGPEGLDARRISEGAG